MAVASIEWTPEIIGRLRALWAEGHSTAEIGRRLRVSKNAIVGKAHRLNLPARPSPIKPGSPRKPRGRAIPAPPRLTIISPVAPLPPIMTFPVAPSPRPREPRPMVSAARPREGERPSCCWPMGEPGRAGFRFCGDDAVRGRPYCEDHCSVAYTAKNRKRRNLEEDADVFA